MKGKIAELKERNPDMDRKEIFKIAAGVWKCSDENPANQK